MKNLEHHAEQMEAARRDFNKFWIENLLPVAVSMGATSDKELFRVQHCAWNAFVKALGITLADTKVRQ